MTLADALTLAAAMFSVGVYGLLARRQALAVLLSVELMANAAGLALVSIGRFRGDVTGEALAIFALGLTVAEVAVGLALVILLYRSHGDTRVELASEMKQ